LPIISVKFPKIRNGRLVIGEIVSFAVELMNDRIRKVGKEKRISNKWLALLIALGYLLLNCCYFLNLFSNSRIDDLLFYPFSPWYLLSLLYFGFINQYAWLLVIWQLIILGIFLGIIYFLLKWLRKEKI
jgi:hypothetical protein